MCMRVCERERPVLSFVHLFTVFLVVTISVLQFKRSGGAGEHDETRRYSAKICFALSIARIVVY